MSKTVKHKNIYCNDKETFYKFNHVLFSGITGRQFVEY